MSTSLSGTSAYAPTRQQRGVTATLIAVPLLVLAAAYAWLALDHGTPLLWNVIVHESGRYTLGETVLYTSHFLREVPTLIAYTLFLLGVGGALTPRGGAQARRGAGRHGSAAPPRGGGPEPMAPAEDGRRDARFAVAAAVAAVALLATALFTSARAHGLQSALLDLAQYRTRDDAAGYGTHWHYHWLSTLWFGAAVTAAPYALRLFGDARLRAHTVFQRAAWGWFLLLTLVFGITPEVFADTRYAGHQAREILTHGPVTALLGLGLLLALHRRLTPAALAERVPRTVRACVVVVFAVPLHLAVVALSGDVMAEGQSQLGLSAMVGAHFMEHFLDYVFVLLLVTAGALHVRARGNLAPAQASVNFEDARVAGVAPAAGASAPPALPPEHEPDHA